jgi:hypothetical protein
MTQSNTAQPSDSSNHRKPRFNASDVAIFVVFPLLFLGGFLLFIHLKRSAADPNLRLIAQVTDDISVELVAVASQSRHKDGSIRWWKPNGLPADDIKDDSKGTSSGSSAPGFYFLYQFNDDRSGEDIIIGASPSHGAGCGWFRNDDEKTITVTTPAKPDIWNTVESVVRIATEGNQYVGELTPEHPQLSTSIGGKPANIAVLSGRDLEKVTMYRPSPCVLKITEPLWKVNSQFSVEVFDEAGNLDKSITNIVGERDRKHEHLYFFNSRTWSRIVIHRTVYDIHVKFEGISSQLDSITSPKVGEISRLKDRRQ